MRPLYTTLACAVLLFGGPTSGASAGSDPSPDIPSMSLAQALATALARNPTLAATASDSAAAGSRVRESRASLYPELSVSAGYTRTEEPNIILPIHQVGVFPPLDNDIYEGQARLSAILFDGGRRGAQIRSSSADAEAAGARHEWSRLETIAGVTRLFLEARRIDASLELVKSRMNVLRRHRHEVAVLVSEGRASEIDFALVEASLAQGLSDSLATASRRRETAFSLARWIGTETAVSPEVGPATSPYHAPPHLQSADKETLAPAVRESMARLEQAEAQYTAATKAYWPELTAFGILTSRSGDDLDFTGEWAAGVAVRMPLYTGGKRRANSQASAASLAAADYRHAAVLQLQQASDALARERWITSIERLDAVDIAVAAKTHAVAAQYELYRSGRLTLSELLTQENELMSLRLEGTYVAHAGSLAILDYHVVNGTLTATEAHAIVEGEK